MSTSSKLRGAVPLATNLWRLNLSRCCDGRISISRDVEGLFGNLAGISDSSALSRCELCCDEFRERLESLRFKVDISGDISCGDECGSFDRMEEAREPDACDADDGGGVSWDTSFLIGISSSKSGTWEDDTKESRCMLVDLWA